MDDIQEWIVYAYNQGGPYASYIKPFLSYLIPYVGTINYVTGLLKAWVFPLITQATSKPDLATLALLLVIVLVSLKILDLLWQSVKFWIKMVWRVVFYGGMAAVGLWFWTRGPEGVVEDVQHWTRTFDKEHQYWLKQDQRARQKSPYGQPAGKWF
ncbi:hypothetical protein AMS68_007452 [Peltaster fructicola]|uniref:Uncharacterized protein n=1 Tax=Peltaster fructicola TaxID=286661 RepID=A0A6H0Y4U7_9PEZI|nr:hypothetical protein AMS68_007452 [Peltaster fructicola]